MQRCCMYVCTHIMRAHQAQMVNKKRGEFTEQDASVMEMAILRVTDALENKFSLLIEHQQEWASAANGIASGGALRRRSSGGTGAR
jgi:predicted oxidoreductase (fatty acid repression mutant protein)